MLIAGFSGLKPGKIGSGSMRIHFHTSSGHPNVQAFNPPAHSSQSLLTSNQNRCNFCKLTIRILYALHFIYLFIFSKQHSAYFLLKITWNSIHNVWAEYRNRRSSYPQGSLCDLSDFFYLFIYFCQILFWTLTRPILIK